MRAAHKQPPGRAQRGYSFGSGDEPSSLNSSSLSPLRRRSDRKPPCLSWQPFEGSKMVERLTHDERAAVLAREVELDVKRGWRVVSQTDTQAQLVKGKPTSHLLHLVLTVLTAGVWLIVWIAVAIFAGEKQRFLSVNEWGGVQRR